ncbi:MAG TPA: hypothetical protein VNZ43_07870 [Sphingomonadaceae bacterium]|nr:hypothetical protein [Sphingomonadaceae bacterium]
MTMQGDELEARRKGVAMSQAGLADAIGMTREMIGLLERGAATIEKRTELAVRYLIERDRD